MSVYRPYKKVPSVRPGKPLAQRPGKQAAERPSTATDKRIRRARSALVTVKTDS